MRLKNPLIRPIVWLIRQSLDESDHFSHYVAALVAMWQRDFERWVDEADKALALSPNIASALNVRGFVHTYSGNPLMAIPAIEHAIQIDPVFKGQYLHFLGVAYFVAAEYEKVVSIFEDRIKTNSDTDL